MKDCETFVRGTIRFKGFSFIISAFHDLGLTSDNKIPQDIDNWRDLIDNIISSKKSNQLHSCFESVIKNNIMGIPEKEKNYLKNVY